MRIKAICVTTASAAALMAAPALAQTAMSTAQAADNEVIVTGVRQSLEKALQVKRQADEHLEVIAAADIGKLPDRNVADALQRLPGINTTSAASGEGGFDENDRVSIRGTSPSLTQVTIDGHAVATGDWFILDQFSTVGRSISFTLLPSEMLSEADVYKTQNASLLEGGVAGQIDLQTRNPLDLRRGFTAEGSLEGAYNSLSGQTKPQVNGFLGWRSQDGNFGVIAQGFYEDRTLRRYGQETLGYAAISSTSATGAAIPSLVGVQAPTLIGSTLFVQEREREGGVIAAQWRPNDRAEFKITGFYSKLNANNVNDNYMYWGSNEINNNVPTAYKVVNNTLVGATFPLNNPSGTAVDGMIVDNITRPDASGRSFYVNLDGKYRVTERLTIKAQVGYTQGDGSTPSEPAYEVDAATGVSYQQSGNGWAVNPTNVSAQSASGFTNDWAWNETFKSLDKEIYGKIDGDFDVQHGAFKDVLFGVRIAQHTRDVSGYDRGCQIGPDGQCGTGAQAYSATNPSLYPAGYSASALGIPGLLIPIAGSPSTIDSIVNGLSDSARGSIDHIIQPQNYYWPGSFQVKERDVAGYVMTRFAGDGWRGNAGVRLVDTQENAFVNVPGDATTPGVITTSAYGDYYVDDVKHDYFDVLPSLNLTFDLTKQLFLRMSAAETMSRPDFSALGGTVSLTDANLTGNGGNPNLKPIKAAVYDASLEYYYGPASLVAISVFYDDLSSYVTFGTSTAKYYSQFYNAVETYTISSPSNTSGELKGFELQLQQPLPYHFGVQANYTYVDGAETSGAPLVGTSRNTFNAVGYFDNGWVSARLAYTYRSHYFVGLDRSSAENQQSYGSLDASLNFKVTQQISFNVDALNLTNNLLKYYAQNTTQVRAVYENGTQVYAGVRMKF